MSLTEPAEVAEEGTVWAESFSPPCGMLALWNSALRTPSGDSTGRAYSSGVKDSAQYLWGSVHSVRDRIY